MQAIPKTVYLKDYCVPPFLIEQTDLTFHLYPASTRVLALMKIKRNPASLEKEADLFLNGENLTLKHIKLNQKILTVLDYQATPEGLTVQNVPDEFELEIVTEINPQQNTELSGLYQSKELLVTQCEAEGFRRIMYFCDRPDVLSIYTTTLIADRAQYPILLANGNLIEQATLDNNQHQVKWHDPFPKPCYLFALVAGKLATVEGTFQTQSGRNVKLHFYVQKESLNKCGHALQSLKQAMQWDEKAYGREYDLDHYMVVAVEDFNAGAMENKGLNIFNSKYILAHPETATDQDYLNIQAVIGHEYFHNWTGNRVTCRDWFQLSLKEGLTVFREQEFCADMTNPVIMRITDVRLLRSDQFAQDASAVAHPVQSSSYMEISNFYTLTVYEKGAEIIRMIKTILGQDGFRKGMDLYFSKYDGQAVTIFDFVHAMEEANNANLSQFRLWYTQAGTPEVYVLPEYDADTKQLTLSFEQLIPPTPGQPEKEAMHIPIRMALLNSAGEEIPLQRADDFAGNTSKECLIELKQQQQSFVFLNVPPDAVPSLLRNFSAPVKLYFSYAKEELLHLFKFDKDLFNRWDALQRLWIMLFNSLISDVRANRILEMDKEFIGVYRTLLEDTQIDKHLLAELISVPTEKFIGESVEILDIDAILQVRKFLMKQIALACETQFWRLYTEKGDTSHYEPNFKDIGERSIRNAALEFLMILNTADFFNVCFEQFKKSTNMTDRLAALTYLMHADCEQREKALYDFYDAWSHEPLVLDMWFAVQARSSLPDTLHHVRELTKHPKFDYKNPNRVHALIGNFANRNWQHFHARDGSGYAFLAENISLIDKFNPMLASRIAEPLSRWKRLDPERQQLVREQLERLMQEKLSKDLYEMVSKSLS